MLRTISDGRLTWSLVTLGCSFTVLSDGSGCLLQKCESGHVSIAAMMGPASSMGSRAAATSATSVQIKDRITQNVK